MDAVNIVDLSGSIPARNLYTDFGTSVSLASSTYTITSATTGLTISMAMVNYIEYTNVRTSVTGDPNAVNNMMRSETLDITPSLNELFYTL